MNGNGTGNGNGNGQYKSRVHVRKELCNGVSINVYEDTPERAVSLLTTAIALAEGFDIEKPTDAHRDRVNQEEHTQQTATAQYRQPGIANQFCVKCGSSHLNLINWTDKKSKQPVSKWRCLDCEAWQPDK